MGVQTIKPVDLGIRDVDMKATLNTEHSSGIRDERKAYAWTAQIAVNNTGGGAAGTAKLTVRRFSDIEGNNKIGDDLDILTAINTKVDGEYEVTWGYGVSGLERGAGTLDADVDSFQLSSFMEIALEVTEVSDATTCTASVTLIRRFER